MWRTALSRAIRSDAPQTSADPGRCSSAIEPQERATPLLHGTFSPAWARQLQCDAESGTSKPCSLSSSWNQSVLQIRKLHINALVLFLLIIFQHCLLIILTPWSNFSSHPLAAHFVLYSCHAHSRSKPAVPWFTVIQIKIFHYNRCLPGEKKQKYRPSCHLTEAIALRKVFSFVAVFFKQVGTFSCCRRG